MALSLLRNFLSAAVIFSLAPVLVLAKELGKAKPCKGRSTVGSDALDSSAGDKLSGKDRDAELEFGATKAWTMGIDGNLIKARILKNFKSQFPDLNQSALESFIRKNSTQDILVFLENLSLRFENQRSREERDFLTDIMSFVSLYGSVGGRRPLSVDALLLLKTAMLTRDPKKYKELGLLFDQTYRLYQNLEPGEALGKQMNTSAVNEVLYITRKNSESNLEDSHKKSREQLARAIAAANPYAAASSFTRRLVSATKAGKLDFIMGLLYSRIEKSEGLPSDFSALVAINFIAKMNESTTSVDPYFRYRAEFPSQLVRDTLSRMAISSDFAFLNSQEGLLIAAIELREKADSEGKKLTMSDALYQASLRKTTR